METTLNSSLTDSSFGNDSVPAVTLDLPSWSVIVFITYSIVIMILGVTGNSVILIVEACNKQRSSTDWLVTFMSVNDLILAGCNTPLYILLFNGSWKAVGSDALCGLMDFVQEICSFSSSLLLTVTSIDRYMKTSKPHSKFITPKRALYVCVGVTIFTVLFCTPIPIFMRYDEERKCRYEQSDPMVKAAFMVLGFILHVTFLIMFLVVIGSYCKIAHTIRLRLKRFAQSGLTSSETTERGNNGKLFFRRNKIAPARRKKNDCIEQGNSRNKNDLEQLFSIELKSVNSSDTNVPCVDTNKSSNTNELCVDTSKSSNTNVLCVDTNKNSNINESCVDTNKSSETNEPCVDKSKSSNTNESFVDKSKSSNTNENCVDTHQKQKANTSTHSNDKPSFTSILKQRLEGSKVNKTTCIMFAVTTVFILSWIPPWVAAFVWPTGHPISVTEEVVFMFCRRSFMVNTCTNPLFYIGMGTMFRKMTKQTFSKLWKVFRRR